MTEVAFLYEHNHNAAKNLLVHLFTKSAGMRSITTSGNVKRIRIILVALLGLVAANALGGGIYGLIGAKEIPPEWLNNSPFKTYFLPSLFLVVFVGGSAILAAVWLMLNKPLANKAAVLSAVILQIWIITQLIIIGFVSWLQPAMAITAVIILLLTVINRKNAY